MLQLLYALGVPPERLVRCINPDNVAKRPASHKATKSRRGDIFLINMQFPAACCGEVHRVNK